MGNAPKSVIIFMLIALFPVYWFFAPQLTAPFLPQALQQFRFVLDVFVYFCLGWFLLMAINIPSGATEEPTAPTPALTTGKNNLPAKPNGKALVNTVVQERARQENPNGNKPALRSNMVNRQRAAPDAEEVGEPAPSLVQEQLRKMKTLYENDDHLQQNYSNKIQKVNFRENEIEAMRKAQKSKKTAGNKPHKTTQVVQQVLPPFNVDFKTLKELDFILPSIEGTFNDFYKAVDKFSEALTSFLTSRDEAKISEFLEQHRYAELTDLLESKANKHENVDAIASLLAGSPLKRLQYGRAIQEKQEHSARKNNIKLYKEIYALLQELFVRYVNDTRKTRCASFDEVIDVVPWEVLEELQFVKPIEDLGKDILEILVEDFLSSLKPPKRQFVLEYRSFRMALRSINSKDPLEAGRLLWSVYQELRATYDSFQKHIAVQGQEEISRLVKVNQIVSPHFKKVPKDPAEASAEETSEKQLRETIFAIIRFLNWMPQDRELVSEEDAQLIDYFNKLLYSRRTRLNIIRDTQKKGDMAQFEQRLHEVIHRVQQSENDLQAIAKRFQGKLAGIQVEIATPCQSEDYFPVRGIIDNISYEPLQSVNMVKLEVEEPNHLKSFVIYTGNNVKFLS